jgi:biotin carboxyl carrier protein
MKLQAEVGETNHEIEIHRDGDQVRAIIDGEAFDVEVSEPEANVFLIKRDGKIFEAVVASGLSKSSAKTVSINGRDIDVRLVDPKRLRSTGADADHAGGLAEIRSAMPGKIVRILQEAGGAVEKGEGVIVVEAMKMQNELKSPKAGNVKEIRVGEGDTVSAGDVLVVIE